MFLIESVRFDKLSDRFNKKRFNKKDAFQKQLIFLFGINFQWCIQWAPIN